MALIIIIGFTLGSIFQKIKIPALLAMILTGILLGPFVLDVFSPELLAISADLREIALIVILLRAGLSLDLRDLRKVGLPALLMCFVPATIEMLAITFLAPLIFNISRLDAMIMGAVVAAVSPAVVVPRMLEIMETPYGKEKSIPQLILASSSVDDVYVIVLFTTFMSMHKGAEFTTLSFIMVPLSIILGLLMGISVGMLLAYLFNIIPPIAITAKRDEIDIYLPIKFSNETIKNAVAIIISTFTVSLTCILLKTYTSSIPYGGEVL